MRGIYNWAHGDSVKLMGGDTFAACCGSSLRYTTPKNPTSGRGICIYEGECGKETDTTKLTLKHVKTKNGILTVVVKKAW